MGAPRDECCELNQFRAGDLIQAWADDRLCYEGTVETVAAHLQVLWIRERGINQRILLEPRDYRLVRLLPAAA